MDEKISEADKIKLKFEAIWKARDNELHAVRERTLLAWGFLIFCYSGYGYLVHEMLALKGMSESRFSAYNLSLLIVALVCSRLSIYWIQLAKGAKAWAENFDFIAEGFQHKFFKSQDCYLSCSFKDSQTRENVEDSIAIALNHKNCASCGGDPTYACVFSVNHPESGYYTDVDENIFTSKSGAFSPAAIAISIARFSFAISTFLAIGNILALICGKDSIAQNIKCFSFALVCFAISAIWIAPLLLLQIRKKMQGHFAVKDSKEETSFLNLDLILNSIINSSNVSMTLKDNQQIRQANGINKGERK